MIGSLIRAVIAAAVALYYRVERRGPEVPGGPALLAANHPNSLLDPILLFATSGRAPRPLAKAPLFDRRVVGRLIRAVGGIPVYRRQDGAAAMGRKQDTFRAAIAALRSGDAIQIFPEGRSHSDPHLSPLRTGAARIALATEEAAGWTLGLHLVPVGLTYVRKPFFRGRAVVSYGESVRVREWEQPFRRDPREAARALTDELDRRLRGLTLDLAEREDVELIAMAERLWSVEHGLATPRERSGLGDRLPRLQAFGRALAWLRANDPDRHRRLRRRVERYVRQARLLGAGDADVPDRYRLLPTLRWCATRLLPVLLFSPLAALAAAGWGLPYVLVGQTVGRMRLPEDVVATYKLAGALVAYPLFLALWVTLAGTRWGTTAGAVLLVALPLLGVLGAHWLEAARAVAADLRLFARVAGDARTRQEMAAERTGLVREFVELESRSELTMAGPE